MNSTSKDPVVIFWFRRDLRIKDNAGLFHALSDLRAPVLPVFIFDRKILDHLERTDPRVTFIHETLIELNEELRKVGSGLLTKLNTPVRAFEELIEEFDVKGVYTNSDYEPYAVNRDLDIESLLRKAGIPFNAYKDHVVFEKNEVTKADLKPYTVFTPYKKAWLSKLAMRPMTSYPSETLIQRFLTYQPDAVPSMQELTFITSKVEFPGKDYEPIVAEYRRTRDYPSVPGTSRIGVHLRFGTISIRIALQEALKATDSTWLSELIWRDFYAMILWHFPWTVHQAFKPEYDNIHWRNSEAEFMAWCKGQTGYPIVDAGMRELNTTGFMHNRVRMIVASFLTKHLLIDWRWGETYFAEKLLDYDQASNVGGWQWAAGSGNDAAPYFRIFNPELQTKKFDPDLKYVRKWVPEFDKPAIYPEPIVDHQAARERALAAYGAALQGGKKM